VQYGSALVSFEATCRQPISSVAAIKNNDRITRGETDKSDRTNAAERRRLRCHDQLLIVHVRGTVSTWI
jgi:hypothetical protein